MTLKSNCTAREAAALLSIYCVLHSTVPIPSADVPPSRAKRSLGNKQTTQEVKGNLIYLDTLVEVIEDIGY